MSSVPACPAGHFNLLYFAAALSYTKRRYDVVPAPLPVLSVFELLEEKYPGIQEKVLDSCAITVNLDYVDIEEEKSKSQDALVINAGDEVAIIPPVSSG